MQTTHVYDLELRFVLEPPMCKVGRYLDENRGMMPLLYRQPLPLWLNLFDMVVISSSISVTQPCARLNNLTCTEMCLCKANEA